MEEMNEKLKAAVKEKDETMTMLQQVNLRLEEVKVEMQSCN